MMHSQCLQGLLFIASLSRSLHRHLARHLHRHLHLEFDVRCIGDVDFSFLFMTMCGKAIEILKKSEA